MSIGFMRWVLLPGYVWQVQGESLLILFYLSSHLDCNQLLEELFLQNPEDLEHHSPKKEENNFILKNLF